MPAIARKRTTAKKEAGIVTELPVLPYPLLYGRITWNDQFDGEPTGSIEYEGLNESELDAIEAAYKPGTKLSLYGIQFFVKRFGYTRTPADTEDDVIDVFTASISLESVPFVISDDAAERARMLGFISYADRVAVSMATPVNEANPNGNFLSAARSSQLQSGVAQSTTFEMGAPSNSWTFSSTRTNTQNLGNRAVQTLKYSGAQFGGVRPGLGILFVRDEIIADGLNEIEDSEDGYNDATLSGGWEQDEPQKSVPNGPITIFTLKAPEVREFEQYSKDYKRPPENTYVLRDDTSQCFDDKGQKKIYKRSRNVNGQIDQEIIETWGFAYLYKDIWTGAGTNGLYTTDVEQFWRMVEYRETRYIYRPGSSVTFSINIFSDGDRFINYAIHPDYTQFATLGLGTVTMKSRAEYLVEAETRGWKLVRLKKEEEARNSLDANDPYELAGLYSFRQIPFISRNVYLLDSARSLQGASITPPFSIEYVDYEGAEPRIKSLLNVQYEPGKAPKGLVIGVIKPDPNFVEPLYVKIEASASNSFTWADDPEGEVDPEKVIPGTNAPLPPPRLVTGEETYNEVRRLITGADTYTELVTEYSSQDPGFDNSIERITIDEKSGSLPSPTSRIVAYESRQEKLNAQDPGSGGTIQYVMNTANAAKVEAGGSASYPLATSPQEGLMAAEVDLRKRNMQNNQAQKTLFNFYPQLRAGQAIACEADRFSSLGQWRIMSIFWTLEYKGVMEDFGLLVTTPGTSVTLGLDKHTPISLGSRPNPAQDPQSDDNGYGNPTADIDLVAYPGEMGEVLPRQQTRRNY